MATHARRAHLTSWPSTSYRNPHRPHVIPPASGRCALAHFSARPPKRNISGNIPKYIQNTPRTSHAFTPRTIGVGDGIDARSEHVPPRPAGTMSPRTYHDRATARPGRPGTPGAPDSTQTRGAIKSTKPTLTFLRPTPHNFATQDELCPKNCRTPTYDTQNAPKSHLF